jgi:hypothetical protein
MLVGGFGDSAYLRREIKRTFGERVELLLANESTWVLLVYGASFMV